jgi:hypothetical protein
VTSNKLTRASNLAISSKSALLILRPTLSIEGRLVETTSLVRCYFLLNATMDALFAQLRSLASSADEAGRKALLDGLRDLSYSIESKQDSIQRILFVVSGACTLPIPPLTFVSKCILPQLALEPT